MSKRTQESDEEKTKTKSPIRERSADEAKAEIINTITDEKYWRKKRGRNWRHQQGQNQEHFSTELGGIWGFNSWKGGQRIFN